LIKNGFYYILKLGMCLQKRTGIILLLTVLAAAFAVLGGCGALDAVLPSTGTYKINAMINGATLDDFSILTSKDKILPFFEESVSEDPDITELVVFLKDSRGLITGYKVTYSLIIPDNDNNKENEPELQPQDKSKTENKDEKKKDEVVTSTDKNKETSKDDAAEKKKDEVVTSTDKNKETGKDDTAEKKKDDAVTSADKNKETGKDDTVTAADKNKETNKDDKKETAAEKTDPLDKYEHTIKGNEIIFPIKSLDDPLPFLPIPADLPIGKYTLVFQVKGKNTILYKFEKPLFYIADAEFSFEGIQVHLPGIAESLQFIQNKNVILLDVNLDFDSRLEPYVVWYNGKKIIEEGRYSDGAGTLFWKAPEQNGFVSIRAEVFPFWEKTGLAGYQKGISLLVSSKEVDMHLLSKDTPNLVQWYVFEDDLNDSLTKDSEGLVIEPAEKTRPNWLPSNGTYGLAAGIDNVFKLPDISLSNNENWQIITRFKPLSEGEILSVQFGSSDVTMTLSGKKSNLVLSLASPSGTYSETLKLPDEKDSFVAVSVKFFIHAGKLSAKMAFIKPAENFINQKEPVINPISIEANLDKDFKIILGQQQKKPADNTQTTAAKEPQVPEQSFTALWDELAILRLPAVEIKTVKDTKKAVDKKADDAETELPETTAANAPDDNSIFPE
jgi:hypothetical protein